VNLKFWTWFSRKAAMKAKRRTFAGDGSWPFYIAIEGEDAIMLPIQGRITTATWFGGDNDPHDDGRTASGIPTRGNPDLMGCALPMQISNGVRVKKCEGSPIVNIPWRTMATVTALGKSVKVMLVDVGPAKWTTDSLDLTRAAFAKFAPLRQGSIRIESVRLHGAAKFFT